MNLAFRNPVQKKKQINKSVHGLTGNPSGFKYVHGLTQDKEKHTAEDPWRIEPSTNQQIQQSRENHLSLFTHLRDQLSLNT